MGATFARLVLGSVLSAAITVAGCASPDDNAASSAPEFTATARRTLAVDPQATGATQTVLANLHSFDFGSPDPFDHRVLVGQEEADVSNRGTNGVTIVPSAFEALAGRPPAVVGYELLNAYPASATMFDAAGFRAGRPAIAQLARDKHDKGALVTLSWHLRCPRTSTNVADRFAPADCPRDYNLEELLERKPNGATGAHFAEWRAMLDELAELLWSMKDDQGQLIPVQIRPFHEFTGNWFWWGRDNAPSTFAAVWREMVTYIQQGRGLHNVLWVFCPAAPSDGGTFEASYPGDSYVDVVAFDRYDFGDGSFARGYEADLGTIDAFARAHGKVAAVSEVGTDLSRRGVDPTWFTRAMLAPLEAPGRSFAYVALWRNAPWEKFVPERGDGAISADFARMTSDPAALLAGKHNLYLPLHAAAR